MGEKIILSFTLFQEFETYHWVILILTICCPLLNFVISLWVRVYMEIFCCSELYWLEFEIFLLLPCP